MNKLVLIDGSSLLSTSFYGNLPKEYLFAKTDEEKTQALTKVMQTSDGVYTNAVFTMIRVLINLLNKQKPTHLAVAWDITRNTFRKKLYDGYKAQRDEVKPELKDQFSLMQDVLEAMGIAQFKHPNYEADDIIGTLSKKFKTKLQTYIYTKDQDALQLVDDHTRVWLVTSKAEELYKGLGMNIKELDIPDNSFEYTPLYMKEFYGIEPTQIVDKKAIEGDPSDNIPGVKGVGEKSIIPLLQEFGTVERLYEAIEDMNPQEEKEFKALLKDLGISRSPLSYLLKTSDTELCGKEAALLSKELATIVCDIDELREVTLDDLKVNINIPGMVSMFRKLEFKSLVDKGDKLLA